MISVEVSIGDEVRKVKEKNNCNHSQQKKNILLDSLYHLTLFYCRHCRSQSIDFF